MPRGSDHQKNSTQMLQNSYPFTKYTPLEYTVAHTEHLMKKVLLCVSSFPSEPTSGTRERPCPPSGVAKDQVVRGVLC